MNHALMGSKPAKLRIVRKALEDVAKPHHKLFDFTPDQWLSKRFDQFANKVVAVSQCKSEACADEPRGCLQ